MADFGGDGIRLRGPAGRKLEEQQKKDLEDFKKQLEDPLLLEKLKERDGKAKGGMIKKKAKDESMAHESKEAKKMESKETRLEKKGYRETSSGKMVKKAKGGLIKGFPKVAKRGY
jgi:hypothetical protein